MALPIPMRFTAISLLRCGDRSKIWGVKTSDMYPYLLVIGPITIASFGAMVALGFLAALQVLNRDLARKGFDEELGSTIITTSMIGGLVGSKLYFVLFERLFERRGTERADTGTSPASFSLLRFARERRRR